MNHDNIETPNNAKLWNGINELSKMDANLLDTLSKETLQPYFQTIFNFLVENQDFKQDYPNEDKFGIAKLLEICSTNFRSITRINKVNGDIPGEFIFTHRVSANSLEMITVRYDSGKPYIYGVYL
jgi:hypothetical protein